VLVPFPKPMATILAVLAIIAGILDRYIHPRLQADIKQQRFE
jgi:hypothetical protein